jgi:hypothetical protein
MHSLSRRELPALTTGQMREVDQMMVRQSTLLRFIP